MPCFGLNSSPEVSGLALHQWSYKYVRIVARFGYAMKALRLGARPRGNGSRSLSRTDDWYQAEKSGTSPGASVARFPRRA